MLAELRSAESILSDTWQRLTEAPGDSRHPFREFVFTSLADGAPDARTVVLRKTEAARRQLFVHTDRRSPKVRQLEQDGRSMGVFYDAAQRLQLRVTLRAAVHAEDAVADQHWVELPVRNRQVYATPLAAGRVLEHMHTAVPDGGGDSGRAHFAVICGAVTEIDWLYLHREGHRRIRFRWSGDELTSEWLAP